MPHDGPNKLSLPEAILVCCFKLKLKLKLKPKPKPKPNLKLIHCSGSELAMVYPMALTSAPVSAQAQSQLRP